LTRNAPKASLTTLAESRAEEDQIAIFRAGAGQNFRQHLIGQEFHNRRLQAIRARPRLSLTLI
jgi:hypothetical protein